MWACTQYMKYSRSYLFNVRNSGSNRYGQVSETVAALLKRTGIWKSRGSKAGQSQTTKNYNLSRAIPVVKTEKHCGKGNLPYCRVTKPELSAKSTLSYSQTCARARSLKKLQHCSLTISSKQQPRVVYANCRSIFNKLHLVEPFITETRADVAVFVETWLCEESAYLLHVPGYTHNYICRTENRGGGVSILTSDKYDCAVVGRILTDTTEVIAVKVVQHGSATIYKSYSHTYIGVYRPPSQVVGVKEKCLAEISTLLENILTCSNYTSLIGDFNRLDLSALEQTLGLSSRVKFPTRENAILDQIVSNAKGYNVPTKLTPLASSDHCSIGFFPVCKPIKETIKSVYVTDRRARFVSEVELALHRADWAKVFSENYDNAVKSLYDITNNALAFLPKRKVKLTNRDPVWKTPIIKDLERRRQKAYDTGKMNLYRELNDSLSHHIDLSRRNHVRSLSSGSRQWWKDVNKTLKPSNSQLDCFINEHPSVSHASESYNDYLLNRFDPSEELVETNVPRRRSSSNDDNCMQIVNHDVVLAINSLRGQSAPGHDQVPAWFLKQFAIHYIVPLCHVYNLSVKLGKFHEMWKAAIVTPLPKCSKPKNAADLRPLSLTSVFAKVFEKIIYSKTKYFWQYSVNSDQFAYRPLCSTTSALTLMTHSWLDFLDKHKQSMIRVIAIDFAKAFDTVDHSLLIGKLCSYDAPYWLVCLLVDYFCNRTQLVRIRGSLSTPGLVTRGIPQGTVLGPVLFSLFTNDLIPLDKARTIVIKYADDQTWSHTISKRSDDLAQIEMDNVFSWCTENRMMLNLGKTKEMVVHNCQSPPVIQTLVVDGTSIECVQNFRILGLELQDSLTWSKHIESLISKLRCLTFAFRVLSITHTKPEMKALFNSVLMPTLLYACPAWCNLTVGEIKRLQRAIAPASRMAGVTINVKTEIESEVKRLFNAICKHDEHPLRHLKPERAATYPQRRPRLPSIKANTERLRGHFISLAVRLFND